MEWLSYYCESVNVLHFAIDITFTGEKGMRAVVWFGVNPTFVGFSVWISWVNTLCIVQL